MWSPAYSVALKPLYGERPVWYGGGTLARDLRLPRLRETWTADSFTAASEAGDKWMAAFKGRRVAHPQPGEVPLTPQRVADDIARMNRALTSIDPNDRDTWSQVARSTAGAFASWSRAVEATPGPIAEAARQISRSAQTYRPEQTPARVPRTVMMHAALALSTLQSNGNPVMAQAIMYRQLFSTVLAIQQAMQARGDAYHARITKDALLGELSVIASGLPIPDQTSQPQAQQQVEPHASAARTGKGTFSEAQLQDLVRITHPETSVAAGALTGIRTNPRPQQSGTDREQSHGR